LDYQHSDDIMGWLNEKVLASASRVSASKDSDIYLYNAGINREAVEVFCCQLRSIVPKRKNAFLILTTTGGDPDAAFLMARCLQRAYGRYSVYIFGPCKSAGTLIVVGATEIVMADSAELGPLDIQIGKDDELFVRSSGLDLTESIRYLRDLASDLFLQQFVRLKAGSSITTKTAAEIAQGLALGVVSPILNQIDPLKLGEMQRSMRVARDYGKLLNKDFDELDRLITNYPSHGFVIDREQAKSIFKNVRPPADTEMDLNEKLGYIASHASSEAVIEMLTPPEQPALKNDEPDITKADNGRQDAQTPSQRALSVSN
jgi:hypothetical protein